jgi:uncharacterized protein YprB with RNaseH-like and TPR domain
MGADEPYGGGRVGAFADTLQRHCRHLDLFMRPLSAPLPLLFFDLETTGLSGGAGTYAFLVGCGWFNQAGDFVTRQYFVADLADERAVLERVAAHVRGAGSLVSFNGKSFDAPLLELRCAYHRLPWAGSGVPHFDLVHPARRFWGRGALESVGCSLASLEQRELHATREGDVAGFEIPARYFNYVRTGDAAPLVAVLEHNRRDLLSLAGVTASLLQLIDGGVQAVNDAGAALGLGRTYVDVRLEEPARCAFRRALDLADAQGTSAALRIDILRWLASAERRTRNFGAAAVCWRRLLNDASCPEHIKREAAEALAVHHEHRERDFAAARSFALQSLKGNARAAWNQAVAHRVNRLERKLRAVEPAAAMLWAEPPQ